MLLVHLYHFEVSYGTLNFDLDAENAQYEPLETCYKT